MTPMTEIPRVCATCKHFDYGESSPYDDGGAYYTCAKQYWDSDSVCNTDDFRSAMIVATICRDYEQVEVALPALKPTFPHDTDSLLESLAARYPDFKMGVTNYPHRAWYERGNVGMTVSGSFVSSGQAYDWLVTRLEEMEAVSVQTD